MCVSRIRIENVEYAIVIEPTIIFTDTAIAISLTCACETCLPQVHDADDAFIVVEHHNPLVPPISINMPSNLDRCIVTCDQSSMETLAFLIELTRKTKVPGDGKKLCHMIYNADGDDQIIHYIRCTLAKKNVNGQFVINMMICRTEDELLNIQMHYMTSQ